VALAGLAAPGAARAQDEDPGLTQTISGDEPVVGGERVLGAGHVDIGPRYDGDAWRLLIHDDASRADASAQSVWRHPDETVLRVDDAAELSVPEGDTYAFVGAPAGATVWVVPQTQNPDVVWVGWNTQDPAVMERIDRGVTFAVDAVQGPGVLTVYLQSGDFGAPQVLWDSRVSGAQPVFVDTNTHTHANWVFTEPGTYLVRMTVAATLIDGSTATDTQLLRFAVGSAASTDEAMAAVWTGDAPVASPAPTASAMPAGGTADGDGRGALVAVLIGAIVVVAAGLATGLVVVIVRGSAARRRVLAGRVLAAEDRDGDGSAT
jgi:putative ABC transporter-associated repeat protein